MKKPLRIILLGANGCGKTSIGHELGRLLNIAHFDVEDYYFHKTPIPYSKVRSEEERNKMLLSDIQASGSYVVSGDINEWDKSFFKIFDFAVYLKAPTEIRMKRIETREYKRWGDRVCEGGDMYDSQLQFREHAASRDIDVLEKRTSSYNCPILRLDSTKQIDEVIKAITDYITSKEMTCDIY